MEGRRKAGGERVRRGGEGVGGREGGKQRRAGRGRGESRAWGRTEEAAGGRRGSKRISGEAEVLRGVPGEARGIAAAPLGDAREVGLAKGRGEE